MFSCFCKKKEQKDFSCQFDESCVFYTPDSKTCKNHGPIKFIREDFGGCIECYEKWKFAFKPKCYQNPDTYQNHCC